MSEAQCPTCRRPAAPRDSGLFPFCSLRCKQADLGRWIREDYRIPVEEPDKNDPDPDDSEP